MAQQPTLNDALRQKSVNYRVGIAVQQTDGTWLDLTDRIAHDRLISCSGLRAQQERGKGQQDVTLSTLVLDNSDGWWDAPPPALVGSWFRTVVRLSLITAAGTTVLGYWLIGGLSTTSRDTCSLVLVSPLVRLQDKSADRVRDGNGPYVNRPIWWLVRQLLLQEFTQAEVDGFVSRGKLLGAYRIPLAATTISSDGTNRALSHRGRPPEWDGQTWRRDTLNAYGAAMLQVTDSLAPNGLLNKTLVALDDQLWRWDRTTDTWTLLRALSDVGLAGFKITHLYWDAYQHRYVGTAWQPDILGASSTSAPHRSGAKAQVSGRYVKFFYGDGAVGASSALVLYPDFSPLDAGEEIYTGHFPVRAGYWATGLISAPRQAGEGGVQMGSYSAGPYAGVNIPRIEGLWQKNREYFGLVPVVGGVGGFDLEQSSKMTAFDGGTRTLYSDVAGGSSPGPWETGPGGDFWLYEMSQYFDVTHSVYRGVTDPRPLDHRFSWGASQGAFAMADVNGKFAFTTIRWDSAAKVYRFNLWELYTPAGTYTRSAQNLQTAYGPYDFQPTALDYAPGTSTILAIAGCGMSESAAPATALTGEIAVYAGGVKSATIFQSTSFGSSDLHYRWVPIAFTFSDYTNNVNFHAGVCFFDLKNMKTTPFAAGVCQYAALGSASFLPKYRTSAGPAKGFVQDAGRSRMYWFEAGTNMLMSQVYTGTLTDPLPEDGGVPPVEGDASLVAGLVYDPTDTDAAGNVIGAVLGISGGGFGVSCDAQTEQAPLTQKMYLWHFAPYLSDRIEIADFADLQIPDALAELAAVGDFVFGIDEANDFFFKVRPSSLVVSGTIGFEGVDIDNPTNPSDALLRVDAIVKDWGYGEVANYVEASSSIAVLGQPTANGNPLARPSGWKSPLPQSGGSVSATNAQTQSVHLRCVQGGTLGTEDDGVLARTAAGSAVSDTAAPYHRLRFAWLQYVANAETVLLQGVSVGTNLVRVPTDACSTVQPGANGYGDVLQFADGQEYTIASSDYSTTGVSTGTTTLTLSANVAVTYATGEKVTLRAAAQQRWSDNTTYGIVTLTTGVNDTATSWIVADNDLVPLFGILRTPSGEDVRVTAKSSDGVTITVVRHCGGTTAAAVTAPAVLRGYWAPIINATYPASTMFAIGGTGLLLRLDVPSSGTEGAWMVGDTLDVIAPGLTRQDNSFAKAVAQDRTSIGKYGKIVSRSVRQSRFFSFRSSSEATKREAAYASAPHFLPRCEGAMAGTVALGQTWLLRDRTLFPWTATTNPNGNTTPVAPDTATAIGVVIRAWTLDPLAATLSLEVQAINPNVAG